MRKKHRIFIAINLPAEVKKFLAGYQKKQTKLPSKWVIEDNLHITLLFLGHITDEELGSVCMAAKNVSGRHKILDIRLSKIEYGPEGKIPPRMIWAIGEKSKQLSLLKKDLQDSLLEKVNFSADFKAFSPHITLAKISAFAWRQIEPEERPEIEENIDLTFTVESIEIMESELRRRGPIYTTIESMLLLNHQ
ncbi:MAG: RNA 2',3'-cyclic phosphodiesterase [Patescibacteria group bacterium]